MVCVIFSKLGSTEYVRLFYCGAFWCCVQGLCALRWNMRDLPSADWGGWNLQCYSVRCMGLGGSVLLLVFPQYDVFSLCAVERCALTSCCECHP